MGNITSTSRVTLEFTLKWCSSQVKHIDSYWAESVNMWRDIVPVELYNQLLGKKEGESAEISVSADQFYRPRDDKRIQRVPPKQFCPSGPLGDRLRSGRFYPQGYLRGIGGVYSVSEDPCRYLGKEGELLQFDLNHPLAGFELFLRSDVQKIDKATVERGGRSEDWLERICAAGPGMQARWKGHPTDFLNQDGMSRVNEQPDSDFYAKPRMVQHLDSHCRSRIGELYGQLLPTNGILLDLMGSWDSHLPDTCEVEKLIVHGLNNEELQFNKRASFTICQDLNAQPRLPLENDSVDGVFCTASIEYLTRPLDVLGEIQRLLKPGGVIAISFSNRWFPPKVTKLWTELHGFERMGLVVEMLLSCKGFDNVTTFSHRGAPRPADDKYSHIPTSDPVYLVWARKVTT